MEMDPIVMQVLIAGAMELVMAPLIVYLLKRVISNRLDTFDERRELARVERAEDKKHEQKQREAESTMILAIARTMLLNNFEKCVEKGYYSLEEREVYSKLYKSYKEDSGNGIIDTIAERIRELPLESPDDDVVDE